LQGLLKKTISLRLGTEGGAQEIKNHPFFEGIDWDKLYRKEVA
jgi:hypothetical protein